MPIKHCRFQRLETYIQSGRFHRVCTSHTWTLASFRADITASVTHVERAVRGVTLPRERDVTATLTSCTGNANRGPVGSEKLLSKATKPTMLMNFCYVNLNTSLERPSQEPLNAFQNWSFLTFNSSYRLS